MEASSKNKPNTSKNVFTMQRMVSLASEFGFVIALPLVCFGLLGEWLDARYHTNKMFTLIGILLALVASVVFLWKRIIAIRAELDPPHNS